MSLYLHIKQSMLILLFVLLSFNTAQGHASQPPSPVRAPFETFRQALLRNLPNSVQEGEFDNDPVLNHQHPLEDLDTSGIPQVASTTIVQEMYQKLRDARAWIWYEMPDFPRRLTWLYPEDGCFLRAALMAKKLEEWNYVKPKQVFAFGDLGLSTPFETVSWWYHVAPIVRVGSRPFVIDPSLDYSHPLLLEEWAEKLTSFPSSAQFAICEAGAVSPDDPCNSPTSEWNPEDQEAVLQEYLGSEWTNLEMTLGEPPTKLLGDLPPWN